MGCETGKFMLYRCAYDFDYNVRKRELTSLSKAARELRCNQLIVVTWDYEGVETAGKRKVKCIPLWKWLTTST